MPIPVRQGHGPTKLALMLPAISCTARVRLNAKGWQEHLPAFA